MPEPRAPAAEAEAPELLYVRAWLWSNHGHDSRYGDDGEMQCGECAAIAHDYKRAPLIDVVRAFRKAVAAEARAAGWRDGVEVAAAYVEADWLRIDPPKPVPAAGAEDMYRQGHRRLAAAIRALAPAASAGPAGGGEGAAASACRLCARGIPVKLVHYGTQAHGMIADAPCRAARPAGPETP